MIGPAQWDESVLGIYWTLVMGSAASEKHEKEERTEAHKVQDVVVVWLVGDVVIVWLVVVVGAFSRCSSHVPKKAAFRIPRDVPGQSCVQVSATIRNLLMKKAIKIYTHKMKHENKPDGTSKHHKEHKEAKLPDSSWDDMTWYIPDPEHGDANLNEVFHHPAVLEYVQSEDFVNYIYSKLGNERAIGDQLVLGLIRLFQYLGPITFFLIQIRRKI